MCITINAIESCTYIPDCMTAEDIKLAVLDDKHIGMLSKLLIHGWPFTIAVVQKDLQPYESFRDRIAIIDDITMKGKIIIIPSVLQDETKTASPEPHGT